MRLILLIIAIVLFILASFRITFPLDVLALGLAFLAASMLPLDRTTLSV